MNDNDRWEQVGMAGSELDTVVWWNPVTGALKKTLFDNGDEVEVRAPGNLVTPVLDLDASAWQAIKQAAAESKWMPPEYMKNDWVSDVCSFLRDCEGGSFRNVWFFQAWVNADRARRELTTQVRELEAALSVRNGELGSARAGIATLRRQLNDAVTACARDINRE